MPSLLVLLETRPAGDVAVCCCATGNLGAQTIAAAVRLLSDDERSRLEALALPESRRDFAVAHALLRRMLSASSGHAPHEWRFVKGQRGKPQLTNELAMATGLSFNLAHTRGLVACAVRQGGAVGVDVESTDVPGNNVLELAARWFSRQETCSLERLPEGARPGRFVDHWVLKEAYLKATGEGLTGLGLDQVSFACNHSGIRFDAPPHIEVSRWRFALYAPCSSHRLAIAVVDAHADAGPPVVKLMMEGGAERELRPLASSFAMNGRAERRPTAGVPAPETP